VPKRVERLSVRRNATRRLVREVFRVLRVRLAASDLLVAQTRRFNEDERTAVRLEVERLLLGVECARH
jgi:ribonuclease P protein component